MLPLDPLTTGTLAILAASTPLECDMPAPTQISVVPRTSKLVIDTNLSHADMQKQAVDTINPYGYGKVTHTNGFMKGDLKFQARVLLDYAQMPQYESAFCVWYKEVEITIDIKPEIVIANEVAQDKCMYKAVLEHEMKHVHVDRKVTNKFAQTVGKKVFDGLAERGFKAGPMKAEHVEKINERMKKTVEQLVEFEFRKFEIERQEAQQAVDSLEEYEAVSAKCPKYRSPVSANIGNQ